MSDRAKIELFVIERDWHLKYPRTWLFWDWVLMPGGLGFMAWWRWALRNDTDGHHSR